MPRVKVAEARRHQHLDRVAEQLGARESEQPLGLRIDERNSAVAADDHHRVRRRFEQRTELVAGAVAIGWTNRFLHAALGTPLVIH